MDARIGLARAQLLASCHGKRTRRVAARRATRRATDLYGNADRISPGRVCLKWSMRFALSRISGRRAGSTAAGEDWLDVEDGRSIERLEITDADAQTVEAYDANAMKPNWIRAVLRARAEHARLGIAWVVAWAHREHVALRTIEPRQQPDLIADGQVA